MQAFRGMKPDCGIAIDMYAPSIHKDQALYGGMGLLNTEPNLVSLSIVTRQIPLLKQLFTTQPRLRRLAFLTPVAHPPKAYPDLPHETYLTTIDDSYTIPPIADLRLDGLLGNHPVNDARSNLLINERIAFLNNIQWDAVRSLSLNGGQFIQRFLLHYGDRLLAIRHLSLWVYDDSNTDPFGDHEGGVEATEHFLRTSKCGRQLLSLELRGYSLKFSFTCIRSPMLESLRFHNYENNGRALSNSIRPASDIRHLAQQCPELCHLAIDFPNMKNLFHPSAIPGVDTDLTVYSCLQAMSEIPKLSHLHLFPPYTQTRANHTTYAQPFADDDLVIRLFKHIKTYQSLHRHATASSPHSTTSPPASNRDPLSAAPRASLTHLLISSDNQFSKWVAPFDAQSWSVFEPANGRFFMTLRQAGREYEQRQVWKGERRLRTEIRRDKYPRHYEGGFADGMGVGWWGMP